MQIKLMLHPWLSDRRAKLFSKPTIRRAAHAMGPTVVMFLLVGLTNVAQAQGTMDFSGAQTLMGTFNGRFAYVSVSRASHDAQIFTNDATNLAESLSKDVSKKSALGFGKAQTPVRKLAPELPQSAKWTSGMGLGLGIQ
jgi:hypothetical protein